MPALHCKLQTWIVFLQMMVHDKSLTYKWMMHAMNVAG